MKNTSVEYAKKLQHPNWQKCRLMVMQRDGFICRMCGDAATTLNIHHLKYHKGDPWNTPIEHLITLCKDCHKEVERMKIDKVEPIFFVKAQLWRG